MFRKGLLLVKGDHYLDYEDWREYRRAVRSYTFYRLYNVNAFSDFDVGLLRLSTPAIFSATVALSSCYLRNHKSIRLALVKVGLALLLFFFALVL